jgi:hypothetical protein
MGYFLLTSIAVLKAYFSCFTSFGWSVEQLSFPVEIAGREFSVEDFQSRIGYKISFILAPLFLLVKTQMAANAHCDLKWIYKTLRSDPRFFFPPRGQKKNAAKAAFFCRSFS